MKSGWAALVAAPHAAFIAADGVGDSIVPVLEMSHPSWVPEVAVEPSVVGYAFASVLFYGTGGWAWTTGTATRSQLLGKTGGATPGAIEQAPLNLNGWTAGAGLSYGFWHNWEVFGEYRYTGYQSSSAAFPLSLHTTTSTTTVSSVVGGLNFRFDPFIPRY
jgi:hypothetical protein